MWKIVAFAVISGILVYISRASLRAPRSHGFYRFFAWEFIAAILLLNIDAWFLDPFDWHQVISWLLLFASLIPLGLGIHLLRTKGKPNQDQRPEPELLGFEKTTTLVTSGVYRYIRHPLYSSLLLLSWGIYFKDPSWIGLLFAAPATLFLVATAKADETECVQTFGTDYQSYMKQTKMFIPYIF